MPHTSLRGVLGVVISRLAGICHLLSEPRCQLAAVSAPSGDDTGAVNSMRKLHLKSISWVENDDK